ncbi:Tip attachment protein J [uncultured Caudovirales phage]|uniref:Tip attachment protein J n=1 Tax=uncultured Caudovirales phage TaxID=2100421 RepID=A0A6J5LG44_9CAUD|nr:Tip attachment protein J [uncultured Caudovirales phage]
MNQYSYTPTKDTTQPSRDLIPLYGSTESKDSIGHLIFKDNPFAGLAGNYQVLPFKEGSTVQEIVSATCAENSWLVNYIEVKIGGQVIPRESWNLVRLKKTAPVSLIVVPQGGGGGGGILQTVAMVAVVVAVSYFTLGAGSAAFAGYFGGVGSLGAMVAGTIAVMGASFIAGMALNALFPPPKVDTPSLSMGASGATQDQTYSFSLDTNTSWQYKPVPRVYGRVKTAPPYAARPFIEAVGDQQYMYLLFDFGYGPLQLEDLRIGENPIDSYQNVEYYIHESFVKGNSLNLYNKDVWQDSYSLKLIQNQWRSASTQKESIQAIVDIQFPQGLAHTNSKNGDMEYQSVDVQLQWRRVGESTWRGFGDINNQFVGDVVVLSTDTFRVTRNSSKPFTISLKLNFNSADEYEIQVTRTNEDSTDRYTADDTYLSSVRSVKTISPIAPEAPHTIVEMKILANDQLNGMVSNFTAIATSKLQTYYPSGAAAGIVATRNPAWAYLDVLMGTGAVRPAPLSRVDIAAFVEWAAWCDSSALNAPGLPRSQCDLVVSGNYTAWQVLKLIGATGDATPSLRSGKYSVSLDKPKTTPVQIFTPRNSSGFSATRGYHIQPHGLRVQYIDPNQEWQQREIVVFDDGRDLSNSTIYDTLQLTGITNYHHAYRIGRHTLAQGRLRQETFTIKVGVENILATRGDLVRLAYDIPKIGAGWARIKWIYGQQIKLDAPVTIITSTSYLRVRTPDGQITLPIVDMIGDDLLVVDGDVSLLAENQLAVYGELEKITMDCLVKSVQPSGDLSATLDLVPYAEGIYNSEVEPIPEYNPLITNLDDKRCGPVVGLQVTQLDTVINRYHYISIVLSWRPPVGLYPEHYDIYLYTYGIWTKIDSTKNITYYAFKDVRIVGEDGSPADILGRTFVFAVVAVGKYNKVAISPNLAPNAEITPVGDLGRPSAPDFFDLDMRANQNIVLEWRHPPNNDIDHYIIRYSPRFDKATIANSTIVVQKVSYPLTTVTVPARLGTYFIKTVDTSGNTSAYAAECITPTEILNSDDFVRSVSDLRWTGSFQGLSVVNGNLTLAEKSTIGYYYLQTILTFEAIYPVQLTSQMDVTAATTTLDIIDDHKWNAHMEMRTAEEFKVLNDWPILNDVVPNLIEFGGRFGEWRKFLAGTYTIKQAQFRIVVESIEGLQVSVSKAEVIVSAPTRTANDYDVTCPVGGKRIQFVPAFQETPSLGITSDNYRQGDSHVITNKDRYGFDIEFFNGTTSVERQFDWIARGFGTEVKSIPGQNLITNSRSIPTNFKGEL